MSSTTSAPQSTRRAAAAPAGRLPVSTRDRRPALAALAVLLILGGALVSGLIALRSGQRVDHLMLNRAVGAGEIITSDDLEAVPLAGGVEANLLRADRPVAGQYATTSLPEGTLLTRAMVEATRSVPADSAVVGLALAAAQRPAAALVTGDVVRVLSVPARGSDGDPVVLVKAAQVVAGSGVDTQGSTDVATSDGVNISVIVPSDAADDVAASASAGTAAVVLLPPGTVTTVR